MEIIGYIGGNNIARVKCLTCDIEEAYRYEPVRTAISFATDDTIEHTIHAETAEDAQEAYDAYNSLTEEQKRGFFMSRCCLDDYNSFGASLESINSFIEAVKHKDAIEFDSLDEVLAYFNIPSGDINILFQELLKTNNILVDEGIVTGTGKYKLYKIDLVEE